MASSAVQLTPRWEPLKPHAGQSSYVWHPARIKCNPSGRRSGKTELAKRKFPLRLMRRRDRPLRMFAAAPTLDQAQAIWWDDLKKLIPPNWVRRYYERPRLEIHTIWGDLIRVCGLDKPQRIEGVPWDWGCVDEIADCPSRTFHRHILPALATIGRTVECDLIGVPDEIGPNQTEWEELVEAGLNWPNNSLDICTFHWRSDEILEPSKMQALRASMDALEFEQEFGGRFIKSGGRALPSFDYAAHVRHDYCEYLPWLPIDWSLDFGTRYIAHTIGQSYRGHTWIMDEIALEGSSTETAVDLFVERILSRGWSHRRIRVFGDAAGRSPSSPQGKSDLDILEIRLRAAGIKPDLYIPSANPHVKDTLNAVRLGTLNANGVVNLHIHPRCKRLISDCKSAPWPDGSNRLKDYHWLAALRYYRFGILEQTPAICTEPTSLPNLNASG